LIDAALGNKQAALEEGRRATELPVSKDAINGPIVSAYFAMIAAWAGEKDLAILPSKRTWRLFRRPSGRLLQTPYSGWNYSLTPITPALLRLDPFWDPLRADPDFQKLCEEKQN
jgi:hypothetical protein